MPDELDFLGSRLRGIQAFTRGDAVEQLCQGPLKPQWQIAGNLLAKARRVLLEDRPRAIAYVERAVRLPVDDAEEAAPAALEAHMLLFSLVTDTLENSEPDDESWLVAAAAVFDLADERSRFEMSDVLLSIENDYQIEARERRRLRHMVATVAVRPELRDLDLSDDELRDHIMAILDACDLYEDAFEALIG